MLEDNVGWSLILKKEKFGSTLMYADNIEKNYVPRSKSDPPPTIPEIQRVLIKEVRQYATGWKLHRLLDLLAGWCSAIGFIVQSLSAMFENLNLKYAQRLADLLERNPSLARELAHSILKVKQHSTDIVTTVLRVDVSPHFSSFEVLPAIRNPLPTELLVRVYSSANLGRAKGRTTCIAVSKCINFMRDRVWRVNGRVMVLCVSREEEIFFPGVISGIESWHDHLRCSLTAKLKRVARVSSLFADDNTLCGRTLSPGFNLFFVISFTRQVHSRAVDEMLRCCKNMGIMVDEYVKDIIVTV